MLICLFCSLIEVFYRTIMSTTIRWTIFNLFNKIFNLNVSCLVKYRNQKSFGCIIVLTKHIRECIVDFLIFRDASAWVCYPKEVIRWPIFSSLLIFEFHIEFLQKNKTQRVSLGLASILLYK